MRVELACLLGVIILALLAAQFDPAPAPASEANESGHNDQAVVDASPTAVEPLPQALFEIDQVCRLTVEQAARARRILAAAERQRQRIEQQLWHRLREARNGEASPAGSDPLIAQVDAADRQARRLDRDQLRQVLGLLSDDQRRDWLTHALHQALEQEIQPVLLTPSQDQAVRRICREAAAASPQAHAQPGDALATGAMERVYLEVLDHRQRIGYARVVAERTRQWHLARVEDGDDLED